MNDGSLRLGKWALRIVIFLCLLVVLWVLQRRKPVYLPSSPPGPVPAVSSEERHAVWQTSVASILEEYDRTKDATQARDALLSLVVTKEDQERHLRLVLAFQGLVDGTAKAAEALQQARQEVR